MEEQLLVGGLFIYLFLDYYFLSTVIIYYYYFAQKRVQDSANTGYPTTTLFSYSTSSQCYRMGFPHPISFPRCF